MAVGANIKYKNTSRIAAKMWKILLNRQTGPKKLQRKICYKAGAPEDDTAADNPNALYDLCVDITNGDIYICVAYSSDASATNWLKITD